MNYEWEVFLFKVQALFAAIMWQVDEWAGNE